MRSLGSLLRKELTWSRRRLVPLLLLFLLLPATMGYVTTGFDNVLPTDTPVAVVGAEGADEGDVAVARAGVTFFSAPRTYDSNASAFRALDREQVYAVVTAPPGLANASSDSTVHVYVDGAMVPYHQPSKAVVGVLNSRLGATLDGRVRVERHLVGPTYSLSAYLVPTFLLVVVMLVALGYLPYNLAAEQPVLDRVRVEAGLPALLGAKLGFFAACLAGPLVTFAAASSYFEYGVAPASPGAVLGYVFTFLALGSLGMAVTLLTRFSTWGRLLNLLGFLFLLLFSGLLYPAGFFSPVRRDVVRLVPTHYASIITRGYALRDVGLGLYADWLAGLAGLAVVCGLLLYGAAAAYEREVGA